MKYKTDIEIAQSATPLEIGAIADKLGLPDASLERYGRYKAKIAVAGLSDLSKKTDGKLILVTAISPTPAGEGKTTTTVGLGDALNLLGKKTVIALREPSLGPVFGVKGGAAGGGYAQVIPMEDINLHFTGDLHAMSAANNLLAAILDNHIHQGNELKIDTRKISWRRCVDLNDRQLRHVIDGLGGRTNGVPREDGFDITVASEVMATLCMADGLEDLKARLGRVVVGYDTSDNPVTAADLKAQGAMATLLKDAIKPNLVQTLENTPALVHGGPFANIAHGCNSISATKLALKLGDYIVTEAGFGADLGAEKFLNIKCRIANLNPAAVVIVATVRALKYHGGTANLMRHIDNMTNFGLPVVVAVNKFPTDTDAELKEIADACKKTGVAVALSTVWAKGGEGGLDMAKEVIKAAEANKGAKIKFTYPLDAPIKDKLTAVAQKVYRADGVILSDGAAAQAAKIEAMGYGNLPVCVAKTQYSFSDNPKLLGAPENFTVNVKNIKLSAGAGFVVALTGDIMTMPGLPKVPAAEKIDVDKDGKITGLF